MYRSRARARASVCGQQNNTNDWKHENIDFREYLVTIWSFFRIQISKSPVVTIHRIPMSTTRDASCTMAEKERTNKKLPSAMVYVLNGNIPFLCGRLLSLHILFVVAFFCCNMFQNYSVWISISSISLNLREMAILCEKQCYRNSLVHRISRNISRMLASNSMQQMRAHTQHTCLMQANDVTLI